MNKKDCALRVVSHLNCARHHFNYHHWNWELNDGSVIQDQGFSTGTLPTPSTLGKDFFPDLFFPDQRLHQFPHQPLDQEASGEASLDIFRWFIINGEGFPSEEIYKDEWLESLKDEDSDDEDKADNNMTLNTTQSESHDCLEQ